RMERIAQMLSERVFILWTDFLDGAQTIDRIVTARQPVLHDVMQPRLELPTLGMPPPHIVDEIGILIIHEDLPDLLKNHAGSESIRATVLTDVMAPAQQFRDESVARQHGSKLTRVAAPELICLDSQYLPVVPIFVRGGFDRRRR